MFVKRKPVTGKPSQVKIQVCENFREGKKVRQKIVKHIGTAKNEDELKIFLKFADLFIEDELRRRNNGCLLFDARDCITDRDVEVKLPTKEKTPNLNNVIEEARITEGPRDIFGFATSEIGFEKVVKGHQKDILESLIAERIVKPDSKKKTQENLGRYAGFECSLDKIYRLLTVLGKQEELINRIAVQHSTTIFDTGIDLLFFDVTTLYFESWNQDELRDFGYSKDCKFGQVQVTLALAADQNGFPLGYKLFPGNTAEVHTLLKCVDEWKKHIPIEKVVFVADRAMFSFDNLYTLHTSGYKFIVACPLKKLSSSQKRLILDVQNYKPTTLTYKENSEFCWVGEIEHSMVRKCTETKEIQSVPGRLIVSYNTSRAKKDHSDRMRMLEKVKKKFENKAKASQTELKSIITNRGYGKYLSLEGTQELKLSINSDKVAEEAAWDGMHGVFTNTDLDRREVLARYRGLWQIEACFRVSKNDLRIRPVFHFTPARVRGHIALCFMSLVTLKSTQARLKKAGVDITVPQLIEETQSVQSSILVDKATKKRYKLPSKMTDLVKSVYDALGKKRTCAVQRIK